MNESLKDEESFFRDLNNLKSEFEKLEPELAVTLRDEQEGVEGYIVVWNTEIAKDGPLGRCGKGGTRITPSIDLNEVKMLARIMALKNAAAGLPLGGSKSGIKGDPDAPGFEKQYRRFVSLSKPYLRENGGIFGGFGFDIGAREIHPIWACDELKSYKSFTGKPVALGGTDYDAEGHAGLGVAVAAKVTLEWYKRKVEGATFSVQGIGAMGAAIIRYFSEMGGKLHSVSDPVLGGTFIIGGELSGELLQSLSHRDHETTKRLIEAEGYKKHDLSAIIEQEVDVFFPSAVQDVVTEKNYSLVRARYVVEGANKPCTEQAQTLLYQKGIRVIPDFIANPGGIIAAFVELTSDVTPEENAKTKANVIRAKEYTRERITENLKQILPIAEQLQVEPRHVGMYFALKAVLGK